MFLRSLFSCCIQRKKPDRKPFRVQLEQDVLNELNILKSYVQEYRSKRKKLKRKIMASSTGSLVSLVKILGYFLQLLDFPAQYEAALHKNGIYDSSYINTFKMIHGHTRGTMPYDSSFKGLPQVKMKEEEIETNFRLYLMAFIVAITGVILWIIRSSDETPRVASLPESEQRTLYLLLERLAKPFNQEDKLEDVVKILIETQKNLSRFSLFTTTPGLTQSYHSLNLVLEYVEGSVRQRLTPPQQESEEVFDEAKEEQKQSQSTSAKDSRIKS